MRFRRLGAAVAAAALASVGLVYAAPQADSPSGALTLRIIVASSREDAQRLVERVTKGEDFAALARSESIDPTARDGGMLGRVQLSSLRPELRSVLSGVRAGQVTAIAPVPTMCSPQRA